MRKWIRMLLCITALTLMLCTAAAAAESDISIELNGQPITFTDAVPQIVNDRTYLPFRTVFTALGFADENITYQAETKTVSAASRELTVSMVIGENKVTVTKNGETTVLDTDVPAFIDPQVSRTYVPARFVAEAAEYRVGWNGETRTVIIDDVDAILAGNTETYKILDKYLEYEKQFSRKNYKVEGTFEAKTVVLENAMTMNGAYSMVTAGGSKFDLEMLMNLNGVVDGEDIGAAIPGGIDLAMCGDAKDGVFYFKSDMLSAVMGIPVENVWYKLDLASMMEMLALDAEGMSYSGLMTRARELEELSAGEQVEFMVRMMAETDTTTSVADQLELINSVLGDSAFGRDGKDYVSSVVVEDEEDTILTIVFHTNGSKVIGYTVFVVPEGENSGVTMGITMKNMELEAMFGVASDGMSMSVLMDGKFTTVHKSPEGQPGEDAAVVDLMELLAELPEETENPAA